MTESTLEVEGETLEEARERLKSQIPEGLYLLSEQVLSDGKPKTVKGFADTIEAAFAQAQSQVPAHATITEKEVLSAPELRRITVEAFDERAAESEVRRRARMELGDEAVTKSLRLMVAGKRGFLGIGKTPNQYEAEVFRRAVVALTYRRKARIFAKVGERKTVRTNLQASVVSINQLVDEFNRLGPYLFIYGYRDMETALKVIGELPYCTVALPYVDCNVGTKAVVFALDEPGRRIFLVATGGNLTSEEAAQALSTCERHGPIPDRRIVVKP